MRTLSLGTLTLFLSLSSTMLAKTGGTISGEVKDPSGALVSGATIKVSNAATNVARSAETNSAGRYNIPGLKPRHLPVESLLDRLSNLGRQRHRTPSPTNRPRRFRTHRRPILPNR